MMVTMAQLSLVHMISVLAENASKRHEKVTITGIALTPKAKRLDNKSDAVAD
jgi:hypothetical protein